MQHAKMQLWPVWPQAYSNRVVTIQNRPGDRDAGGSCAAGTWEPWNTAAKVANSTREKLYKTPVTLIMLLYHILSYHIWLLYQILLNHRFLSYNMLYHIIHIMCYIPRLYNTLHYPALSLGILQLCCSIFHYLQWVILHECSWTREYRYSMSYTITYYVLCYVTCYVT